MGLCASTDSDEVKARKKAARNLDAQLKRAAAKEQMLQKLLLLGAGESGKSTIFKQFNNIYGEGFNVQERNEAKSTIWSNVIGVAQTLAEQVDIFELTSELSPEIEAIRVRILDLNNKEVLTPQIAEDLFTFWKDPVVQSVYDRRAEYQLTDSADFFLNKVHKLAEDSYVPTEDDMLRMRVRTTGIVEKGFRIDNNDFRIFDVGGQRNERRKWIHCFEGVTAILFVAAMSAYDQKLYEDDTKNRLVEALQLFAEICENPAFKETAMILFLNKKDLFEKKRCARL